MAQSLTLREELILGILQQYRGESNAISSRDIASQLPGGDSEGRPVTRAEIRNIIQKKGVPIGANHAGYFIIEDTRELMAYQSDLYGRAMSIMLRAGEVEEAFFD